MEDFLFLTIWNLDFKCGRRSRSSFLRTHTQLYSPNLKVASEMAQTKRFKNKDDKLILH